MTSSIADQRLPVVLAVTSCLAILIASSATAAEFIPLGTISQPFNKGSVATGLSADGTTVIGYSSYLPFVNSEAAFHWTRSTGMQWLGKPDGFTGTEYRFDGIATVVSADGSTVAGLTRAPASSTNDRNRVTYWTMANGMSAVESPSLYQPSYSTGPTAVSGDGESLAIQVHMVPPAGPDPDTADLYLANSAGALTRLDNRPNDGSPLNAGFIHAEIVGLSERGETAFGHGSRMIRSAGGWVRESYLLRWSEGQAPEVLTRDVNYPYELRAFSADGTTAVTTGPLSGWYRWRAETGLTRIVDVNNGWPTSVSGDGSIVVGIGPSLEPWIWDEEHGARSFVDAFDLADERGNWLSFSKLGGGNTFDASVGTGPFISADGLTIAGTGTRFVRNGEYIPEAYFINTAIPEPESIPLVLAGSGVLVIAVAMNWARCRRAISAKLREA
jgi:hypothetical protein